MNRKKRIENILLKNFNELLINVVDNSAEHIGHNNFDGNQESHFQIFINKKISSLLTRLELHRKINELLKDEFLNGLHALEVKTI